MRRPSPPGTAIDARRYRRWIERFGSYREGIINVTIESWLDQFAKRDRDLAARVLDSVDFYGQSQIHAAYRQTLAALVPHGWHGPSMATPGYDLYYLNVMAGPTERAWLICDDPAHAWVRSTWDTQAVDARLPFYTGK